MKSINEAAKAHPAPALTGRGGAFCASPPVNTSPLELFYLKQQIKSVIVAQ
jgi:hypothetical protein